jgi:Tfp pilus assembly protein FimT
MSELSDQLARTEAIKAQLTKLLRELEASATGSTMRPDEKPGQWRQHPAAWADKHLPKKLT